MKILKSILVLITCCLFFGLDSAYKEINENIIDEGGDLKIKDDTKEVIEEETKKEKQKVDKSPNNNKIENKKESVKTETKKKDKINQGHSVITKEEKQKEINIVEKKKEQINIWNQLEISEYEYYNTPQWKWQTIDFELNGKGEKSCISSEDCRDKCIEYGEDYILKNEGGYRCSIVLSYSGKYLGEHFKYFKLET